MRVLVTGAGGFVGRHATRQLVDAGHDVQALGRGAAPSDLPGATWHDVDLFDTAALEATVRAAQATHLLHLAWITTPGIYWDADENTAWHAASRQLLAAFAATGGQHAVLAGTCAEYDWTDGHCVEEETPLRAESAYSSAKLAFRSDAFRIAHDSGLRVAWARLFFLFGPGERRRRLVPAIVRPLLAGRRAACSDGQQLRDFLDVRDAAAALNAVLESDYHGDVNIASGTPLTIRELVTAFAEHLDALDRVDFGARERGAGEPDRITADTRLLEDVVGWSPRYALPESIRDTVAWWQAQRHE